MQTPQSPPRHSPAVTILKPLHRGEPDLSRNLETFFAQHYDGPVQIVFGVHDEADPAVAVVRALQAKYPHRDTAIVADAARYGANAKVSNLINMLPSARHDTLVLSDSDIAVGPLWLSQVTAALARPGVGIVTCLYTGEPAQDGHKLWSSLAAMGTSYTFLPNAVLGTSLGLAAPCFGSTIALQRARPWMRWAALPLSPTSWPTIMRWAGRCAARAIPWPFPPWAWATPRPKTARANCSAMSCAGPAPSVW